MASEIRVNKIINRSGLSTVTFSDTGAIVSGIVTANNFSGNITGNVTGNVTGAVTGSGANLTSIPAGQLTGTVADARISTLTSSKLSGALPSIDGSNLTGINAGVGTQGSVNTSGIITATAFVSDTPLSHRNLIINGAMNVSQRGSSFASLGTGYTVDRFRYTENIDTGVVTVTQESITDLPGFAKAAKINCTTAEAGVPSKAGSKFAAFNTKLEGQDLQQLAYGTSSAKQITLSFYVKSNVTGTFCVSLYKGDQTARNVSLGYTISSANTWEKKTLTYPADTGGGGIDNDNGSGLEIYWVVARQQGYQGAASTTWGNNTDARFANLCTATIFENTNDHIMFTGVQLEVGSVATPFEHRNQTEEFNRCRRYFQKFAGYSDHISLESQELKELL